MLDVQLGAFRQLDVLGEDLGAVGQALDIDHNLLGQVGDVGANLELLNVDECHCSTLRGTLNEHRHLNVDLLAGLDLEEVDVLDDALDRVLLHVLDNGHLGLAAELDGEQGVGVAQSQGGLTHRQGHEGRVGATGVNGGRDLVGNAQTAGNAFAELVADFAFKLNGGSHIYLLESFVHGVSAHQRAVKKTQEGLRTTRRVDYGSMRLPRQDNIDELYTRAGQWRRRPDAPRENRDDTHMRFSS